jgi:hypothetical protein
MTTEHSQEAADRSSASSTRDRPLNGFRIAKTQRAIDVVRDVRGQVQAYEMHRIRERVRRTNDQLAFERQVEALVCDLAHRELSAPGAWLAVSFSKQTLGRKDRYRPEVFRKTLPDIIQHMASPEMEFVEIVKGFQHFSDPLQNRQTVIRAGRRLEDRIKDHQLSLEDFSLDDVQELIILKDTKEDRWDSGKWLQYEDTEQTIADREELQRINDWLIQSDIEYMPTYDSNRVVDTTDRRLRRYFNNSSFEQGGRLFGGFWQPMSKAQRKGIVIDGMETVTLDYGQMVARILYGIAGVTPDFDDAYSIPGLEGYRAGVKQVLSAMLFTDKSQKRKPQGTAKLLPEHLSYAELADKIKQFHLPVAEFLHTGIGLYLLYQESRILLTVLSKLMKHSIVALPIHDAVLVADADEDLVRSVMLDVFKSHTGIDGIVTTEE